MLRHRLPMKHTGSMVTKNASSNLSFGGGSPNPWQWRSKSWLDKGFNRNHIMLIQHPSDLVIPIQFMDPKDNSQLTCLTIDYCRTHHLQWFHPGPNPPQKKSENGLIVQDLMVVVGVHLVIWQLLWALPWGSQVISKTPMDWSTGF